MPNPKLETYKNKATGTVYDFTDADAQSKISATVDLLKDTTGWTGKNKAVFQGKGIYDLSTGVYTPLDPTNYGAWKKVSCKGGEKFIFVCNNAINQVIWYEWNGNTFISATPHSDLTSSYDEYTVGSNTTLVACVARLTGGNITDDSDFGNPMIADAVVYSLDPSHEPYHESVEEEIHGIYDFNAKTGVHQLIPTKLSYLKTRNIGGTWTGNSYTFNGITYDISVDDNDNVTKIAVSGNSTAYSEFLFADRTRKDFKLSPTSNYIISLGHDSVRVTVGTGNSGDGSTGTYVVVGRSADNNEVEFTGIDKYVSISIDMVQGINISDPVDIYPLLRYAEDINNGYGVFAMTNEQLTDAVTPKKLEETSTSEQAARITVPTSFRIAYAFVSIDSDKTFQCVIAKGISSRAFRFTYKASSNTEVRGYIWYDYTNSRIEVGSFMVNDVEMKNDTNIKLEVFYI